VKAELRRGVVQGARTGLFTGLGLAVVYVVLGVLGDTEFTKSLGYSLLLVGFPTLFAVVPALQWLGLQGGTPEAVVALFFTLTLNGMLWGALIGAAVALRSLVHRKRIGPPP
jgi:hypothetical protein